MAFQILIAVGFALASLITGVILNKQAQDAAANVPDVSNKQSIGDITNTLQTEGVVIPVGYGWFTVTGNNLWWKAEKVNDEYYLFKMWQSICMGDVWKDYTYSGDPTYDLKKANYSIWQDDKGTFMSDTKIKAWARIEAIIYPVGYDWRLPGQGIPVYKNYNGYYDYIPHILNPGTDNVDPHTGLLLTNNDNKPNATKLKGVTHIYIGSWYSRYDGVNNYVNKPMRLRPGVSRVPTYKYNFLRKLPDYLGLENEVYNGLRTRIIGTNPASIIYDLLVNEQYGANIDSNQIDLTSFQTASNYYSGKRMGLNFVLKDTAPVKDTILKIQEWTDTYLIKNTSNLYSIKILQDIDVLSPSATIDIDQKAIEFTIRRKSWEETFNTFTSNYFPQISQELYIKYQTLTSPPNQYWSEYCWRNDIAKTVSLKNEANIRMTGGQRKKFIDLSCYGYNVPVRGRLYQIMKKESYPFANASLTTNLEYDYLQLGDVVFISSDEYNVSAPYRITNIGRENVNKNRVNFELIEMREIYADAYTAPVQDYRGANGFAAAPICQENLVFDSFSDTSTALSYRFQNDADSRVYWGTGQLRTGELIYGEDYTVIDHNKIKLDPILYADEIMFNSTGLMNIDVYEEGCPSIES